MGRTTRKLGNLGDTQPLLRDLASLEAEAARQRISEDTVELPKARLPGTFGISSESAVFPLPAPAPAPVARALADRSNQAVLALVLLGVAAALVVALNA